MKKKLFLVAVAAALGFSAPAQALPLLDIDVSAGTATRAISGDLSYLGTTNDLKSVMGLGDSQETLARLKLKHALPFIPNIYFNYLPMSFSGNAVTSFTYNGQTVSASSPTSLSLSAMEFGLFYDIPMIKTATAGVLEPEIGINAKVISFSGKAGGQEKSASLPVPMVYLGLGVHPIKLFSVVAEAKSLSVGGNGITDWSVEVKVRPMPILYLSAGYFSESLSIDASGIKADIKVSGPYFAVGASF